MQTTAKRKQIGLYYDDDGRTPYTKWFNGLDREVRDRVDRRITKLIQGQLGHYRSVSSGVFELKIDYGPGYRIYIGEDSGELVILLGGGSKKSQQADIEKAIARWRHYLQGSR